MSSIDPHVREKAAAIRLVIFDIDGVMTDGGLYLSEDGKEQLRFHIRDGQGLVLLHKVGLMTAVISGRQSPVVSQRMKDLGTDLCFLGQLNKVEAFGQIMDQQNLQEIQIAYIGDDLTDLEVLRRAGLALAPKDARPEVLALADWVTPTPAGHGAVRDICDLILDAQGYDTATLSALACGGKLHTSA